MMKRIYVIIFSLWVILTLISQTCGGFEVNGEESLFLDAQKNYTILKPCSEDNRNEDTLHYDGSNFEKIGGPSSFYAGVRFTPEIAGTLIAILFYHCEEDTLGGNSYVYEESISTYPGQIVRIDSYSVIDTGWHRIELFNTYPYEGNKDFWTAIEIIDYPAGKYPMGVDSGPAVDERGDWISLDSGTTWDELQNYGLDYNWNIRAIVHKVTGVEEKKDLRHKTLDLRLLYHPNPFTTSTTITLSLPSAQGHKSTGTQEIELSIYDVSGRLVKDFSLTPNHLALGTAISWDGTNSKGEKVPSGLYFYFLKVGRYKVIRKIVKLNLK